MVAIIGGEPRRFRPLIDLYRETGARFGQSPERLIVGVHALGYVAETTQQAVEAFYPGYARAVTDVGKERGWAPMIRRRGAESLLSGMLFDLTPLDPATYAAVGALFAAVALAASYLPASRATRVDPVVALRCD